MRSRQNLACSTLALLSVAAPLRASAAEETNAIAGQLLLLDSFGKPVLLSTNEIHPSLHPPADIGLKRQIPAAPRGSPAPAAIRQRIEASKTGEPDIQWFPSTPPALMPYLQGLDEFGNTALQPGAAVSSDPISQLPQAAKYRLSELGLRYSFWQSVTMVNMSDVASGASDLEYYTATFVGKWALTERTSSGTASWLSTEANVQLGLSPSSRSQSPQDNLGTIVDPLATVSGPNGVWLSELAWQQSLADGKIVVLAGLVDQSNYLDANSYANNSQGQFLNSALVNSDVLPLPFNNLGLNLQWQLNELFYAMLGTGANNQAPGHSPFDHLSSDDWSYVLELGVTPKNVFGLGPGTYRIQPFLATVGGDTQVGLGLNVGQQLGEESPFACYGRFVVGGSQVTLNGASAQIGTGFSMQAPLKYAGWFPKLSNDYLGAGFIWSQPSAIMKPAAHSNEYGFETTYVLQITPLASIQPDLQVIWNPANNPNADYNVIFQLQLNLTW